MSTPMSVDVDEGRKDRKPKDTRFKQQKLPAWQPIMTAGTVLPAFFAIGIAFIPLGVGLLITSNSVQEVSKDYTNDCVPLEPAISGDFQSCGAYLENNTNPSIECTCQITLQLEKQFKGQVYMYYGLTNYYQNHRRYVKSRDDKQLRGDPVSTAANLDSSCDPYKTDANNKPYAPCGAIANSLFSDRFQLQWDGDNTHSAETVSLSASNIAWDTDINSKFANPSSFDGTVHPPAWDMNVSDLADPDDPNHYGYKDQDLIVWMRTAALPTFRKLHRRINHQGTFADGLPAGNYTVTINYRYPVLAFEGSKRIILTTTSWMGGKNPFLGIAYLVVGSICIVLGIVFVIIHVRVGKNPSEMSANVNHNTHY